MRSCVAILVGLLLLMSYPALGSQLVIYSGDQDPVANTDCLQGKNGTWAAARSSLAVNPFCSIGYPLPDYLQVGAQIDRVGTYRVWRSYLYFDATTATHPELATATIDSVYLRFVTNFTTIYDNGNNERDYHPMIIEYDWSALKPITAVNALTAYAGCLAAGVANGGTNILTGIAQHASPTDPNWPTNTAFTVEVDKTWVSAATLTYYCLASDRDVANQPPTKNVFPGLEGYEPAIFWGAFGALAAVRPQMIINYTPFTPTPTSTPTQTNTPTQTSTPSNTPVNTSTLTPTATVTDTPTITYTSTPSSTPLNTCVPVATDAYTRTRTATATATQTFRSSRTVTATFTRQPTRTRTSATVIPTRTPTTTPEPCLIAWGIQ